MRVSIKSITILHELHKVSELRPQFQKERYQLIAEKNINVNKQLFCQFTNRRDACLKNKMRVHFFLSIRYFLWVSQKNISEKTRTLFTPKQFSRPCQINSHLTDYQREFTVQPWADVKIVLNYKCTGLALPACTL